MTTTATGPGCEQLAEGFLAEPISAWTSLAFVAAATVVLARARAARTRGHGAPDRSSVADRGFVPPAGYAGLVAGIGIGSFVQHGPDPPWSDVAHDLPLLATLALVGADSVARLTGRVRRWWWWVAPTAAILPIVVLAPRAGDLAQVALAVLAVALTVARALTRREERPTLLLALLLLAGGGAVGTLSRAGGPLCDPDSLLQGHAVWHVLAAAALVVLAPVVTGRAAGPDAGPTP